MLYTFCPNKHSDDSDDDDDDDDDDDVGGYPGLPHLDPGDQRGGYGDAPEQDAAHPHARQQVTELPIADNFIFDN